MSRADIDWVGGIISLPGRVTGEGEPYRPELLLWLTADRLIVGMDTARPGELIDHIVTHFQQTSRRPMVGPPHVPTWIQVASEEVARALRAGLGDAITVVCAPTPELDAIVAVMSAQMSADAGEAATTYLAPGLDAEAMASFFRAAAGLFEARPWTIAPDDESLLLVTSEAFGLSEAVICFTDRRHSTVISTSSPPRPSASTRTRWWPGVSVQSIAKGAAALRGIPSITKRIARTEAGTSARRRIDWRLAAPGSIANSAPSGG